MERFQGAAALHVLPNYAFSAALAAYYQHKEAAAAAGETVVTATGVHGMLDNAALDGQLATAVLTHPVAFVALAAAMREQVHPPTLSSPFSAA